MGAMYAKGTTGVTVDNAEAIKWFLLAALQGSASAFCFLGIIHEYGDGVDQDDTMAAMKMLSPCKSAGKEKAA